MSFLPSAIEAGNFLSKLIAAAFLTRSIGLLIDPKRGTIFFALG